MCLYLPEQEIAIEITDDEQSQPFEPEAFPGIRLIRLTKAQVARLAACQEGGSTPPDDSLGTQAMAWQRVTSRRRGG